MQQANPGHLKTFDYIGPHRYSLTFCCADRRRLFVHAARVDLVLVQISRAAADERFAVLAFCFMPDHLHLLVEGTSADADCKRFIKLAKQYSGFHFKKLTGQVLWQRYGFERVLRNEELTPVVARYILQNPLRAGLVKNVEDYPFVGSLVFSLGEVLSDIQSRST